MNFIKALNRTLIKELNLSFHQSFEWELLEFLLSCKSSKLLTFVSFLELSLFQYSGLTFFHHKTNVCHKILGSTPSEKSDITNIVFHASYIFSLLSMWQWVLSYFRNFSLPFTQIKFHSSRVFADTSVFIFRSETC